MGTGIRSAAMTYINTEESAPPEGEAKAHEAGSVLTVGRLHGCAREEAEWRRTNPAPESEAGLQPVGWWLGKVIGGVLGLTDRTELDERPIHASTPRSDPAALPPGEDCEG